MTNEQVAERELVITEILEQSAVFGHEVSRPMVRWILMSIAATPRAIRFLADG